MDDSGTTQGGRRRWQVLSAVLVLAVVGSAAAIIALTVAWRGTYSDFNAARASLASASEDHAAEVRALKQRNARLAGQARNARGRYVRLRRDFNAKVRDAVERRLDGVRVIAFGDGYEAVFGGYDEPWRSGHWYIVRVGRENGRLALSTRSEIEPDSGITYWVDAGDIYYDDSASYAYAPGGYNEAGCPKNQWVDGYFRSDGTWVNGYWRNSPTDACDSSP